MDLSTQHFARLLLFCSILNQGCKGGLKAFVPKLTHLSHFLHTLVIVLCIPPLVPACVHVCACVCVCVCVKGKYPVTAVPLASLHHQKKHKKQTNKQKKTPFPGIMSSKFSVSQSFFDAWTGTTQKRLEACSDLYFLHQ